MGLLTADDFPDFARAYAASACVNTNMGSVRSDRPQGLNIRLRNFLRFIVGVTHAVPAEFSFPANLTCS